MNITGSSNIFHAVTGKEDFNLTCIVTVVVYLTVEPTVQWSGGSVWQWEWCDGVKHYSQWTLTFSPLRTLHTKAYTCQATINIAKAANAAAYVTVTNSC